MKITNKQINLIGFSITSIIIIGAIASEYLLKLTPCNLCLLQRGVFTIIAINLLLATLLFNKKIIHLLLQITNALLATIGAIVAGKHVYLQYNPDPFASCGISLQYMLKNFPLSTVLTNIFSQSANCQEIQWSFMGVTIPMLALGCFIALLGTSIYLIINNKRQ